MKKIIKKIKKRIRDWIRQTKEQIHYGIKQMKTRDFWIEYIALYTSILIVTIFVQAIILNASTNILIFCMAKSLCTTIGSVIAIMIGRRTKFVQKHWFMETLLYTIASMPYLEITTIYGYYTQDILLLIDMTKWYAITYFLMGLGIKKYLRLTKEIITKYVLGKKPAYIGSGFFVLRFFYFL